MEKLIHIQAVALAVIAVTVTPLAAIRDGDTMSLSFNPKPVAWVEESSCGEYAVRGRIMLCGKTVEESIRLLRDEYRPMGGMTVWEYAVTRFHSMQAYSISDIISENTLLKNSPTSSAARCSPTCCCSSDAETMWLIDITFTDEEEAKLFKAYLEDTMVYFLTYLNNICARSSLAIERQPCAKWSAKISTVICGTTVEQFVSQTATEAKMNELLLLPFLKCQHPSMIHPSTMLDLLGGIRQLPIEWSLNGCQCSSPLLWDLTATFTEEDDATSFLGFMNSTYPAILALENGQCSNIISQEKRPTEAVYTAQITTRMCAYDDVNLIEDGQRLGGPNEFQYIINALQEGYTPIDDVSIFRYMQIHFQSMMFPQSPSQLANQYNVLKTDIPFWCMDELSTCCCAHPVEWRVTAKFGMQRDADYFAQYMSRTVPAYLSTVHKVCTVNAYKGLFEFVCDCDQDPPAQNPSCPVGRK